MSFICKNCKKSQPNNQPANFVVTQKREKSYEVTTEKMKGAIEQAHGWETVVESKVCPDCFKALTGTEPRKFVHEVVDIRKVPVVSDIRDRQDKPKRQFWTTDYKNRNNPRKKEEPQQKRPVVVEVVPSLRK